MVVGGRAHAVESQGVCVCVCVHEGKGGRDRVARLEEKLLLATHHRGCLWLCCMTGHL